MGDFGHGGFGSPQMFLFLDSPIHKAAGKSSAASVTLSGSTIAAIPGDRFVAIDEDSGNLIITDASGAKLSSKKLRSGAGELVVDSANKLVYVADRRSDRIVKLELGENNSINVVSRTKTPAEPFGLALSPDGRTLLATTVADRTLVAFATKTMTQIWSEEIGAEPRGLAISPDGREAMIAHLSTGAVTHIDLETKVLSQTALNIKTPANNMLFPMASLGQGVQLQRPQKTRQHKHRRPIRRRIRQASTGQSFARNAFAATYLRGGIGALAYQESTPIQVTGGAERVGTYGGGFDAPIKHRIAFFAPKSKSKNTSARRHARAETALHQPRALAYNSDTDELVIAAIGNDTVIGIRNASSAAAELAWQITIPVKDGIRCGPSGVALGADGNPRVFCSFSRRIATVTEKENKYNKRKGPTPKLRVVEIGDELAKSRMSKKALLGKALFHRGSDFRLSTRGAMACSSCHPEARADGLSWRIDGHSLQTPLLGGGRLEGTHPFKWDGKDKDIENSLKNTVRRLGGNGIGNTEVEQLKAFFAVVEKPRSPTTDRKAIARGEKLFKSKELGCNTCHSGNRYTDRESYPLADDLEEVDTPSLVGLASSAPYYHDGSAATLRALLSDKADVHGMGGISRVKESHMDDLIAFLNSL